MANNSLALLVRSPEIDLAGTLRAAAAIRQAETAQQLGDLRLRQANEQEGALKAYANSGSLDALKAHPEVYGQALQNLSAVSTLEASREARNREKNARDAQYLLGLPAEERAGAYHELLDNAYREKRVPGLVYQRMKAMGPNDQVLQSIIDQALPLAQKPSDIVDLAPDHRKGVVVRDPTAPAGRRFVEIASAPKPTSFKDAKQVADVEEGLRKEYATLAKPYFDVRDAFARVEQAARSPSAAGDLALIFNYMKMLDPGSVVREGEFATAQNAAGVPTRVINLYNKALTGERLAPSQREDFVGQARGLYQNMERQYQRIQGQYKTISERTGVDPRNTVVDFSQPPPPVPAPPRGRTTPVGGGTGQIPPQAVRDLMADPSPLRIRQFDEVFGAGKAQQFLTPR